MRSLQKLVRNYIEPLKTAFDSRVTTDGGTNEANDTQIDTWINPWLSKILTLPNAFKAGELYSLYGGDWDVVRATAATRVNESGLIESVASNVPRIDYLNGEPVVLVEPQRTNLLLRSEEIDNSVWNKTDVSVTANSINSPSGSLTAEKIIPNTSNTNHRVGQAFGAVANDDYTFSLFAKKGEYNFIQITFLGLTSRVYQNIDLNNKVFAASGNDSVQLISKQIYELPNDWVYIVLALNNFFVTNFSPAISVINSDINARLPSFTGDGTSGVYLWGVQLEHSEKGTSYIPTTTATVTRNADVITEDVPAGTTQIIVTMEDGSQVIENSPGATYQLPNGRIKSIQML